MEGFGIVILEAFQQKKPVLVSNIRPMSDIISHDHTGYVVEPHDEKAWSENLLAVIKNPEHASIMGTNGHRLLESTYSQESMYEKIMKMYLTSNKLKV